MLNNLIVFAVSFIASITGAICGIGGGILIKPFLDVSGILGVQSGSFLSGCTVLSMSGYSISKNFIKKESKIALRSSTPLALGAALGGILGKTLFQILLSSLPNNEKTGAIQATTLIILLIGTLIYIKNQHRINTLRVENIPVCFFVGVALGSCSAFLGIGGGPFNLAVLQFLFSMDIKTAAQNSLFIILFSQAASLVSTICTNTVPDFELTMLLIMIFAGLAGAAVGQHINKTIRNEMVQKLLTSVMILIIFICFYNIIKTLGNIW